MTDTPEQPYDLTRPSDGFAPIDYPDDVSPPVPGYPPLPPPYPPVASPFSAAGPPGYPPPAGPPPYPPPYPQPGYPQPGFTGGPPAYPGYPGGYDPYLAGRPPGTNGMAIASLVCSLGGLFFCGVPSIVGLILGIVAIGQCKRTGQEGYGMALTGVIIGAVITVLALILLVFWIIGVIVATNGATVG